MIHNDNGKQYEVLETFGKYMLLKNLSWKGGGDSYLVVYNLSPDGKSWQQGSYFDKLQEALKYFEEKMEQRKEPSTD